MALVSYRWADDGREGRAAFEVVRDLTDSYPGFAAWFFGTAMPDLATGRGRMLLAEQDGGVVGLALGKRDPKETKLRCLRVVPRMRGRGIGVGLVDRMLAELGCDRPLVTVPQDMLHEHAATFVNRYGFGLTAVERGTYREGRLEYIFNGAAPEGLR
jgi:GNAT superfamily N-acetyltransferase